MTAVGEPAGDVLTVRGALSLWALGLLGYTLELSNGTLQPRAMLFTTIVVGLCAVAAWVKDRSLARLGQSLMVLSVLAMLVTFIAIHLTHPPGVYLRGSGAIYVEHHYLIAAAAVLCGITLTGSRRAQVWLVPAMLGVYGLLGLWLLQASPAPSIDVWVWHNAAYDALAHGQSPYAVTIPNIYHSTQWYAPGLADEARVNVGYPYPPLTLLLGGLGHWVKGDYRYFNLVAQLGAAALLAYARPSRAATWAAALFLFTPRGLFVLEQGWTEATSSLALAAVAFCAVRFPKALVWVFGLMVGIKQYFIFAVPLLPLLLGTRDWRQLGKFLVKAAIVPVAVTLPFMLWNFDAFISAVVTFQAKQPFRSDSLSVMAWLVQQGGPLLPLNISFVLAFGVCGVAVWRNQRGAAGFAAVLSFALLLFFFFAKQAFTNYYYLILASLAVAAALSGPQEEVEQRSLPDLPPRLFLG